MGTLAPAQAGMISNPGQPQTAAMHYTSNVVVYTAGERVECVVDGAPPGPNGRLFIVEVDDPTEVPYEAGRFMLEHLSHTGVVRVNEVRRLDARGKTIGVEYDVEEARARSEALLANLDQVRWQRYINDLMDDYVSRRDGKSKAVPPPPATILRIMERRGYKLSDFGIKPVGFEDPGVQMHKAMSAENKTLRDQIADMQAQMAEMRRMIQANGGTDVPKQEASAEESDGGDDDGAAQQRKPVAPAPVARRGNRQSRS